jgi:hypothetical protein
VVVGPVANFNKPQPSLLFRAAADGRVPERIRTPRYPELRSADAALRAVSERSGAEFASPLALTCNDDGCIVALDGDPQRQLALDEAHLTRTGADFVVGHTLAAYFDPVTPGRMSGGVTQLHQQ